MATDISRKDVQALAQRSQISPFFQALGFDVTKQTVQTTVALNIKGSLQDEVIHIERVGELSDETWTLEVYLFEMRSITKAVREALAQTFRNLGWDYLLVLTTNYDQLDFQLVERVETEAGMIQSEMIKEKAEDKNKKKHRTGKPRPRVIPIERQKPGDVAMRVLRLLRYNREIPVFDYCEKLRSVYDVAYWSEAYFNNRALFSDYYLKERLPERTEWQASENATGMAGLRRQIVELAKLYADADEEFKKQPTVLLQDQLIAPILNKLGFDVQAGTARGKATQSGEEREADYVLYLKDSKGRRIEGAVGFCLAYAWKRDLDRKIPLPEDFDARYDVERLNENPGAAVVALLDAGVANWAIVTNGEQWRLYTAKAHSRATNYYEIDLEEIANNKVSDVLEAYRYFWFLFRAEAFRPTETITGESATISLLNRILKESEQYAHDLGEKLKNRIFDDIFPHFAQGFVENAKQQGAFTDLKDLSEQERTQKLKEIFDGTLTFLYRLLFLLYAESRGLLPVYGRDGKGDYYPYSLEALKATVATSAGISEDAAAYKIRYAHKDITSTEFYDQLQILFEAVDKGSKRLNVPTYNGGLFMTAPEESDTSAEAGVARFLHKYRIPDQHLALGLDLMARIEDDKEARLVFVDYKSLGVRQLGSIYEGLLEFKLHVAFDTMTVVPTGKGKKTEKIIPWEDAKQQKISPIKVRRDGELIDKIYKPGEVYLINDRSERKATGSYYTPDYIVKYIIEHTVGEVLTEKMESLKKEFEKAQLQLIFEQQKIKGLEQRHITAIQSAEHATYLHFKDTLNEQFFDLKVLDPAMGSGHFLVEAVDYITDRMAHFLEKIGWNPVVYSLKQMQLEIQQQMEKQEIEIDVGKLTDINLLKRQVLKRCIYGVDINPMAVELAKVSVWLDSFTLGAPLSFLDHHLKCGNSLIGSSIHEIQKALTTRLWGSKFAGLLSATQLMRHVNERSDATADQVLESRKMFKEADTALEPFKQLANIWTSEYFGNKGAKDIVDRHVDEIIDSQDRKIGKIDREGINKAEELANSKQFFHWDLEFPEVFYGETERKTDEGFDAVVGNPPYGFKGSQEDKVYLSINLQTLDKRAESYIAFMDIAHKQVKKQGFVSFIVPDTWLTLDFTRKLREQLLKSTQILQIVDLPNNVFPDATVDTTIFVTKKQFDFGASTSFLASQTKVTRFLAGKSLDSLEEEGTLVIFNQLEWSLEEEYRFSIEIMGQEKNLIKKVRDLSEKLADICAINYGLKAYQQGKGKPPQTRQDVNEKAFTSTRKIDTSYYRFFEGEDISRFSINVDGNTWLKYGKHLAEPRYFELFTGERLLYRKIVGKTLIGTVITDDALSNTLLYIIKPKKQQINGKFLLCLLNSSLLSFFFKKLFSINPQETFPQIMLDDLKLMPIYRINFITSDKDRAYYGEKAQSLYEYCLNKSDEDYACVLEFVNHHLSKEPEASDIVHDLLAYLAEQMLDLNKEKRAREKEFLEELAKTVRIQADKDGKTGIDVLTNRQKIIEYAGDYQKGEQPLKSDELVAILRKNKARLGRPVQGFIEDEVRRLHKESLAQVLPIKERLRRTDYLIDQVVYRLYGLTEEEIGIVEGNG